MNQAAIFELVVGHTKEVLPELENHSFKPEEALKDLGANSIDRSEIVMMTLESLSADIPLVELAGVNNLKELVEKIHGKLH